MSATALFAAEIAAAAAASAPNCFPIVLCVLFYLICMKYEAVKVAFRKSR